MIFKRHTPGCPCCLTGPSTNYTCGWCQGEFRLEYAMTIVSGVAQSTDMFSCCTNFNGTTWILPFDAGNSNPITDVSFNARCQWRLSTNCSTTDGDPCCGQVLKYTPPPAIPPNPVENYIVSRYFRFFVVGQALPDGQSQFATFATIGDPTTDNTSPSLGVPYVYFNEATGYSTSDVVDEPLPQCSTYSGTYYTTLGKWSGWGGFSTASQSEQLCNWSNAVFNIAAVTTAGLSTTA